MFKFMSDGGIIERELCRSGHTKSCILCELRDVSIQKEVEW